MYEGIEESNSVLQSVLFFASQTLTREVHASARGMQSIAGGHLERAPGGHQECCSGSRDRTEPAPAHARKGGAG